MELLTLTSEIAIEGLSPDNVQAIKTWLTLVNPRFDAASRMNKVLFGIPQNLKYYREEGPKLIVPVGLLSDLKKLFPTATIVDNRFENKLTIPIQFTGQLRDYQNDAVQALAQNTNSVLCALTGCGKTAIMIKRICDVGQHTLILVNTIELANQFIAAIIKFTDLKKKDIGFIGSGKKIVKPITVALLQTIVTMDPALLPFGMIIFDECHQSPADTYFTAMSKLNAKYKYACSGTPTRSDGLTNVIFWATGPLVHTVPQSALTSVIIKPTIRTINTDYKFPLFDTSEFQGMISDLSKDTARNKLILDTLQDYPTQQIVLLCQRKEQVELLRDAIPGAAMLTSDMGKKARVAVMNGLITGTIRHVVSTFQLFSTGIDVDSLEIMFLCAPIKSNIKVRQSAGRLMRVCPRLPNKQPIIVDFVDRNVELLKHQWYLRSRILRTL